MNYSYKSLWLLINSKPIENKREKIKLDFDRDENGKVIHPVKTTLPPPEFDDYKFMREEEDKS